MAPLAPPVWDPGPRKPRLILFALSLLVTIATTAYSVWWVYDFVGIRHQARADACPSLDLAPIAAAVDAVELSKQNYVAAADDGSRELACTFTIASGGVAVVVAQWYRNAPAAQVRHSQHRTGQFKSIYDETVVRDVPAGQEAFGSHDPEGDTLTYRVEARDHNLLVSVAVALRAPAGGWSRGVYEKPFATLAAAAAAALTELG